jgi:hypothetical protein
MKSMPRPTPFVLRAQAIKRVEAQLRGSGFPRLQMMLLVGLTGGFGLLASFTMLHFGLDAMAARYSAALVCSYLFFLLLVWLWLRTKAEDYLDVPDISGLVPSGGPTSGVSTFGSGGGGDFGGGGASGSFEAPAVNLGGVTDTSANSVSEAISGIGDADELAIPVAVIALAIGLAVASLYVVYIAPVLFAEVLVDGALSYALFRHLRRDDRPMWLLSAMRHTLLPFLATGVFLAVVGGAMSAYAPGAKSVGQVIAYASAKKGAP